MSSPRARGTPRASANHRVTCILPEIDFPQRVDLSKTELESLSGSVCFPGCPPPNTGFWVRRVSGEEDSVLWALSPLVWHPHGLCPLELASEDGRGSEGLESGAGETHQCLERRRRLMEVGVPLSSSAQRGGHCLANDRPRINPQHPIGSHEPAKSDS